MNRKLIKNSKSHNKQKIIAFIMTMVLLFTCIPTINVFADDKNYDNGSNIKIEKVTKQQENDLYKLCKVWGFVKYYHPKIATGDVDWDDELFRIMPKALTSKNDKEFNDIIYEWINKLGDVKISEGQTPLDGKIVLKPDIKWIENKELLGDKLSDLLVKVSKSERNYKTHKYIDGNIEKGLFQGEKNYPNMKYTDDGYKLMSLFRCWNIVEYFFAYRDIMDRNWDDVLKEYIPKFIKCNNEESYKLNVLELMHNINDTHVMFNDDNNFLYNYFGKYMLPLKLDFIENKVVVTEVVKCIDSNPVVKQGDIITKIDNKDISALIKEKEKYLSYSRTKDNFSVVSEYILRSPKNKVQIEFKRGNETLKDKLNCTEDFRAVKAPKDKFYKLNNDSIAYICPFSLEENEVDKMMQDVKNTKGLIIDLRYYPAFPVFMLYEYLLPKFDFPCNMISPNFKNPGEFIEYKTPPMNGKENPNYYKGKVTILVNKGCESKGEFTAMTLRTAPNSVIIGSNSGGVTGQFVYIPLPGVSISMSLMGACKADGTQTQRVGVKPDIGVNPTIKGIKEGRDEVLEKAIQVINESK
ncbi:Peptidase family S41 [Clostridium cavendishii DSM 21758]|uniref:Peptidase family S41 n=1 Tax=Clostridium cavendishii DSM 21758 TaxID=1121302 RepID=A0A1M6GX70_9CLOT|nr:S41 family peptidase [Clostridium cavendishii]SHJ14551.1 Peptidase family S41 [Clostridium cavendishii DSM 21758]